MTWIQIKALLNKAGVPPVGWGASRLDQDLDTILKGIAAKVDSVEAGEVTPDNIELTVPEYNSGAKTDVEAALREIAGTGRTNQTVKGVHDAVGTVAGDLSDLSDEVTAIATAALPRIGVAVLDGSDPTDVVFGAGTPATVTTGTDTFDLVDDDTLGAETFHDIKINVNAAGVKTIAVTASPGYSKGDEDPMTDTQNETDTKFVISVDGGDPVEVDCDWTGCENGAQTAAQLTTAINTVLTGDGQDGEVLATYETTPNFYLITSLAVGAKSSVEITRADELDVCDELKIGPAGDEEVVGTALADVREMTEVTAAELGNLIMTEVSFPDALYRTVEEEWALNLDTPDEGTFQLWFDHWDHSDPQNIAIFDHDVEDDAIEAALQAILDANGEDATVSVDGTAATSHTITFTLPESWFDDKLLGAELKFNSNLNDAGSAALTYTEGTLTLTTFEESSGASIINDNTESGNVEIGLQTAQDDYGASGLGFDTNMADGNYTVIATFDGVTSTLNTKSISVTDKTAEGFKLRVNTNTRGEKVAVAIFGTPAE